MDFIERSKEVFDAEIGELKNVRNRIGREFADMVNLILKSKGKVVITGIGKSGIIGHKISSTLASTGTPSVFMNAAEAMHGDLGMICKDDVVVAISNSGFSQELLNILPPIKKIGCPIVAMTGDLQSELVKRADIAIDCGVVHEAGEESFVPTCSSTAALVMGDALAMCLMEHRAFKMENFAFYHPGGALGRRLLTKVSDCMNRNVPRVQENTLFKDVIYEVSKSRQGVTLVYKGDVAVGIITDGDIRRAVQKYDDLKVIVATDIMTNGFKKILPEAMITDALAMMDENKITSLVVPESDASNAPIIGVLHIHNIFDFKKTLK